MKKILIAHIPNTLNYGSAMMAINLISGLREGAVEEIEIYCDSDEYHLARLREATGDEKLMGYLSPREKLPTNFLKKVGNYLLGHDTGIKSIVEKFDMMIVVGGDDLSETYMKSAIIKGLMYRKINENCMVILAGQSFGPFTGFYKLTAKWIYRKLTIITREDNSHEFIKYSLGLKNTLKSRDLAIKCLPEQQKWKESARKFYIKNDYIAIVPSGLFRKYIEDKEIYISTWICIIKKILHRDEKNHILLIAHVLKPDHASDATVINEIIKRIDPEYKGRISSLTQPMQPAEARAILGGAKYVITGRMHAAVSSFFEGKPALSLAYSEKFFGVIGRGFGLPQLIIDCRSRKFCLNSTILDEIEKGVNYIESEYSELIVKIEANVQICKAMVDNQIEFLSSLVSGQQANVALNKLKEGSSGLNSIAGK